jgi:exopolysaccharide biosynthesis polyprenyl glycosylphosphotransferase
VRRQRFNLLYLGLDFLLSAGCWLLFWYIRKQNFELRQEYELEVGLLLKSVAIGLGWNFLIWAHGLYRFPFKRSRIREFILLIPTVLIGVTAIALVTFVNDPLSDLRDLRSMVLGYSALQFGVLATARLLLSSWIKAQIRRGHLSWRTLLVGGGRTAARIAAELQTHRSGHCFVGYLPLPTEELPTQLTGRLPRLGQLSGLPEVVRRRRIEELVIALDESDHRVLLDILNRCEGLDVQIHVVPDLYDCLVGNVKIQNALDESPLIEIYPHLISPWQLFVKRMFDIGVSAVALVLCLPLFAVLAVLIRIDSRGPVFFRQERVGRGGRPFMILKFRTMYTDAERHGPALSRDNDPRITRVGRFLRKTRLDEFPQFLNVLRGEMSLVGPRPERQYYIDQIVERAPEYLHLLKVKPGITSLGQVRYGYAENVDQMIERMRIDILYIENISFSLDLKILLSTVLTVLGAKGK